MHPHLNQTTTMETLTLTYYLLLPLLLLLAVFFTILKLCSSPPNPNSPPSPPSLPFIGHIHFIKDSLHLHLTSLASRYGPIYSLRCGCLSFLVVSSPSAIEECFTKNDLLLASRPRSMAGDCLAYNYSVFAFSPYGHLWRILRRLSVVELFASHRLQKSAGLREKEVRMFVRVLGRVCRGGERVDLNYLVSAYSFNHIMNNISGKRCVDEEEVWGETGRVIVQQFRGLFFSNLALGICDFFPVLRWIGYKGLEKEFMWLRKRRDVFLQGLVDEFKWRNNSSMDKKEHVLIETLLSLQASEPELYTDDVIKGVLTVLFVAGTETSGATLEWAMSLLLTHPQQLHKLRQEIDANVGHHRLINQNDLAKLPYLRCVVNETLRLHTPVPLLLPHYASDVCSIGGYTIAKDTVVLINAWAVHRDPHLWDDPHKFKPERFQGMEVEKEGYKFIPFGMGRRACPGAGMATRTIALALGAFVQCFEWKIMSENEDMNGNYNSRIIYRKTKPLEAMCHPRQEAADLLSQL